MTIFNFTVYNGEKVYNRNTQTMVGSWEGGETCTAKISYSQMNWDTYQNETVEVPLTLGGLNPIDLSGVDISITLTANNGFKFTEFVDEQGLGVLSTNTETLKVLDMAWSEFSGHYDKHYQFKVTLQESSVIPPDPDPVPSLKIDNTYLLTEEQFNTFKTELYNIVEGESISDEFTNPAKFPSNTYVIATKLMPFTIPDSEKVSLARITVKQTLMEAQGIELKDNVLKVNLGSIEIPYSYNGGALDYMGVNAELFLPFYTGSIDLNADLIMGRTINIEYQTIINNGDTTINIYNDAGLINTIKANVGGDFPLFNAVNQDELIFAPTQALNDIMKAYVLLTKPEYTGVQPKAQITDDLTQLHGDVQVLDHNISINAYADEKLMLDQMLSQGVKFA